MTQIAGTSISFEQFILDEIGLQIKREGIRILPRYKYLNRALDILLENQDLDIKKIYAIIAKENNISENKVKEEILLAMKEIFQRKQQKEKFIQIFKNKKVTNVDEFLKRIIDEYKKINLQK